MYNKSERKIISLPGADILFADSISDLHELPVILLSHEWSSSLRKVSLFRRIISGNVTCYLDQDINNRVLSNLIGTINLSKNSFDSFKNKKTVCLNCSDRDKWVLLPSYRWFEIIHLYVDVGFRQFVVLPAFNLNSSLRSAITSLESNIVFLPNYKVMYSSIRDFMRSELNEFNNYGMQSGALNRMVNMKKMGKRGFVRFSVVRNPWERAQSAFMDKIGRDKVRENEFFYTLSIKSMMQVEKVEFIDYVRFISKIPDSHSDPHWLSQFSKLYNRNECLVDHIGYYEKKDEFLSLLRRYTNLDWNKLQNTNPGPRVADKTYLYNIWPECHDLIATRYSDDIVNFGYNK